MIIRIKTTNVNADKFGQTVELILEIITNEEQTWLKFNLKNKLKPIKTKMLEQENYKFLLKGIASRNPAVLIAIFKLLMELGSVD